MPPFRVANPIRPAALPLELLDDEELDELDAPDEELLELLDDEELDELLVLELLDDEDELELDDELELLLDDEELLDEELEELEEPPLPGIEHSFTPPGTLAPTPKVTSPQTKLPLNILKVNRSARP